MTDDHLPAARALLRTRRFGQHFLYYPSIGSTNTEARAMALHAPEGTLLITDEQTQGRGRMGRRWLAPPGSALLMSLILHPPPALQPIHLSILCALAWCDTLQQVAGLPATLKWPNDILVDGRKLAGLLTESVYLGDTLAAAIVGMGINIHQDADMLANSTAGSGSTPATSVDVARGAWTSRGELLVTFLPQAEARYSALSEAVQEHADDALHILAQEWASRLDTLGRQVRVRAGTAPDAEVLAEGTAESVDASGALLVRDATGTLRRVLAGDVTLR